MADSPRETYCEPQDIGAVNEYPLWRESPEMVCWHRAIREWLGGGGGVAEMSGRAAGWAHPLEKSAPGFEAQAYMACPVVRYSVEITADSSPSAAMGARSGTSVIGARYETLHPT